MATRKSSAKSEGRDVPIHEKIRRDAALHPERTYSEHTQASRSLLAVQYAQDLLRCQGRAKRRGESL